MLFHIACSANNITSDITFVPNYGKDIVLECPIQLGVLTQSYTVSWYFIPDLSIPEDSLWLTDTLLPSLTLVNIQEDNIGTYICVVNVTNPYDGTVCTSTGVFGLCT